MIDRFNRLFARTLRDLRRYAPQVVVQNVGQLNLAQAQLNIGQTGVLCDSSGSPYVMIDGGMPDH
jgi:hypothetical protein